MPTYSTEETGHAKNIANFNALIALCEELGQQYQPQQVRLKLPHLKSLAQTAKAEAEELKRRKAEFDTKAGERRTAFADLKALATRVTNAFEVSGALAPAVKNMKQANAKLQGNSSQKKGGGTGEAKPMEEMGKTVSASQQSYDKLEDHFGMMLSYLEQSTVYAPNEGDLKLEVLREKLELLSTANEAVRKAYRPYKNALNTRNHELYDPLEGLVQVAKEVKKYLKGAFGAKSPEYKDASGIEFKSYKP